MPDEKATAPSVVNRLLDQAEEDNKRTEREHKLVLDTLSKQVTLWQRTTIALILVLFLLVAAITGVGVSGTLPGVGDIEIKPRRAEAEVPKVELAPASPEEPDKVMEGAPHAR